MQCIKN